MAEKTEQDDDKETLNVRLGVQLRGIVEDYADDEGVDMAAVVRRCLLTKECLADRYKKRVEELIRKEGLRALVGK